MKFISLPTFSNREDLELIFRLKDSEDGTLIEIDADTDEIVFEVRDECDTSLLLATLDNGKITITDTGVVTVAFPRSEMTSLTPKQYQYGLTFARDGSTSQVAKGAITITSGIVGV